MISVGIIGGTGYTGKHLILYCDKHPLIQDYKIYSKNSFNKNITEIFPELLNSIEDNFVNSIDDLTYEHDLYFVALPHGESLKVIPELYLRGKKIIDLGGDFRLDSADLYSKWYNYDHDKPELLKEKIYGLADISSDIYANSRLVANPGCYPTAVLLSILPLFEEFSKSIRTINTSAYSGTSGAGKSPKADLLLSEMYGNVKAYNVNSHKHEPEIIQYISKKNFSGNFSFVTHLVPISQGIFSTSFLNFDHEVSYARVSELYQEFYKDSPFVRLRKTSPEISWVVNSNYCDITFSVKDNVIIITSAIDNLIKGASGQAMQNLNKLFGFDQTLGIINKESKNVDIY